MLAGVRGATRSVRETPCINIRPAWRNNLKYAAARASGTWRSRILAIIAMSDAVAISCKIKLGDHHGLPPLEAALHEHTHSYDELCTLIPAPEVRHSDGFSEKSLALVCRVLTGRSAFNALGAGIIRQKSDL